jgi:hypothetical protein
MEMSAAAIPTSRDRSYAQGRWFGAFRWGACTGEERQTWFDSDSGTEGEGNERRTVQCLYQAEPESSARELRQNVKGEMVRQNGKYVQTGKPISGEFACGTDMWRVQGRKGTAMVRVGRIGAGKRVLCVYQ